MKNYFCAPPKGLSETQEKQQHNQTSEGVGPCYHKYPEGLKNPSGNLPV